MPRSTRRLPKPVRVGFSTTGPPRSRPSMARCWPGPLPVTVQDRSRAPFGADRAPYFAAFGRKLVQHHGEARERATRRPSKASRTCFGTWPPAFSLGGERLHGRERILDPVVELVDERLLAGFGFLPLRYVDQHVDRPDELAGGVAQRRREGDERHPPPVRPLRHGLVAADRPAFLERHRHRALVMSERRAVRPPEPPR